jgi:hypothetical protein
VIKEDHGDGKSADAIECGEPSSKVDGPKYGRTCCHAWEDSAGAIGQS